MRKFIQLVVAAAGGTTLALAPMISASAHEVRTVGAYEFTVGWLHEPAYADEQNAVQFLLKDSKGNPVTDLTDSLKVEVIFENQKLPAQALNPTFDPDTGLGRQGEYLANLIPTRPGNYTFHFTGTIKSQAVDQSFTSSPTTFDPVKEPTAAEFPAQDPSRAQIAQRLDRLDPRLTAVQTSAKDDATQARNLAIAGIVVGALGLIVAGVALTRGRGTRPA